MKSVPHSIASRLVAVGVALVLLGQVDVGLTHAHAPVGSSCGAPATASNGPDRAHRTDVAEPSGRAPAVQFGRWDAGGGPAPARPSGAPSDDHQHDPAECHLCAALALGRVAAVAHDPLGVHVAPDVLLSLPCLLVPRVPETDHCVAPARAPPSLLV